MSDAYLANLENVIGLYGSYTFDGVQKTISLSTGTVLLDVRDLYSRWKDWVLSNNGVVFHHVFEVTGGDPVDLAQGIYVSSYFFLANGWKIRPQEADHKLKVMGGILVTMDGTDPFVQTIGAYNVLIQYSQPIKSEAVHAEVEGATLADIEASTVLAKEASLSLLAKQEDLARALGLAHENFEILNPEYDANGNMTSCILVLYANNLMIEQIANYQVTATYDANGRLSYYSSVKL